MIACPIRVAQIQGLAASTLPRGLDPWVYHSETHLYFGLDDADLSKRPYPFRLDTGSQVSMIPVKWFNRKLTLLGQLSREMNLTTVAGVGTATGRMARDVPVRFQGDDCLYVFDLLLTSSLQDFGLLSLRDIHNHFRISQSMRPQFSADHSDRPLVTGALILAPWR